MNTGEPVSAGSIKRAAEIPTQAGNCDLFDTSISRINPSMSIGSGLDFGQSSRGIQTVPMIEDWEIEPLRAMAKIIGVPYDRKTSRIQLVKKLKYLLRKVKIKGMRKWYKHQRVR